MSDVEESRSVEMIVAVMPSREMACNENCWNPGIWRENVKGLEVRWQAMLCGEWERPMQNCRLDNATNMVLCQHESK